MNDNGWQELFNVDSVHPYKLLIVDGIQSSTDFPLTLIEHISTTKIAMKRRGKDPGYIRKGSQSYLFYFKISKRRYDRCSFLIVSLKHQYITVTI